MNINLDSLSRSPIFAAFSETINGLTTIRAYKKEALFTADNERRVDENQKAYFLVTTANRWLGLRLEVVGTTVVFGATFLAVMNRDTVRNCTFPFLLETFSYGFYQPQKHRLLLDWLVSVLPTRCNSQAHSTGLFV